MGWEIEWENWEGVARRDVSGAFKYCIFIKAN